MTEQHPITPPPELVKELQDLGNLDAIALAYQAGADQELEACVDWISKRDWTWTSAQLLAARRPKPPSLKQQALEELEQLKGDANSMGMGFDAPAIRRALEALDD